MKILFIRFSSIGDIVLCTPAVRCLKKQRPDTEIHFLTKTQFKGILEHNPYIHRVHTLDERLADTIRVLREEKFDYIIDLHHNLRSWRIKKALGIKSKSFDKLNFKKWLLVNLHINRLPDIHIVERYLHTLTFLDIRNDGQGLDYFIPHTDQVEQVQGFSLQQPYVALVIGATHFTKRLPVHKAIELCQGIQHPVIILGGKSEMAAGQEIAAAAGKHVLNTCGQLSLNQSAYVVKQSSRVISNDTGLMHIAAAFRKPIVSVWGNTVPALGMYPYYGDIQVPHLQSEVTGLSCRPCSKIGYAACPKKHFKCMEQQQVQPMADFLNAGNASQ